MDLNQYHKVFWNIQEPEISIFYKLAVIAVIIMAFGLYRNIFIWFKGAPIRMNFAFIKAVKDFIIYAILNKKIFKDDIYAGIMHLFILWGFIFLGIGTAVLTIHHRFFHFLKGYIYLTYSLALDIFGILFFIGLAMAVFRRYFIKFKKMNHTFDDVLLLGLLLFIAVTGFALEIIRIKVQNPPLFDWSPAAYVFFFLLKDAPEKMMFYYKNIWWTHAVLSFFMISYFPYSKLFHAFGTSVNIFLESAPLDIMTLDEKSKLKGEYTIRTLIAFDGCTRCNRCENVCPSFIVGESFSPRDVIGKMKQYARIRYAPNILSILSFTKSKNKNTDSYLQKILASAGKSSWNCTTCRRCMEECPGLVNITEVIRQIREKEVEKGIAVPQSLQAALEGTANQGNPWATPRSKRAKWASSLAIKDYTKGDMAEVLYFIGCSASYDTRNQEIAKAMHAVFSHAGVSFGILGKAESCCGDIARRTGEVGLFEQLAQDNLNNFKEFGIKNIVTTTPHCYNIIKNDYPIMNKKLNINCDGYNVLHYTQFVAKLIDEGKLAITKPFNKRVTFHDPCYLGRYNSEYAAPRKILKSIPGIDFVEMKSCKENGICCGGGGGRMWIEAETTTDVAPEKVAKIGELRIKEATDAKAEIIATCCPFCLTNMDDAIKTTDNEGKMEVKDIIEIVKECI